MKVVKGIILDRHKIIWGLRIEDPPQKLPEAIKLQTYFL